TYDVVIDTEQWHYLSAWTAHLIKTSFRIGFDTRPLRKKFFNKPVEYILDEYELYNFRKLFEVIEPKSRQITDIAGCYDVSSRDNAWAAEQITTPSVAFFIGASIPERRLTQTQMIYVIQYLHEQNLQPVLLGGKDVVDESKKLHENLGPGQFLDFVGKTSLEKSAALIKRCKFFIGPDSGILHLACAVGTPAVAIFGPGNIKKWAPRGNKNAVVSLNVECSP
ncbi:MAG: glycosyltransferase family 9 protein, partial [Pseudomonadota bacterium]